MNGDTTRHGTRLAALALAMAVGGCISAAPPQAQRAPAPGAVAEAPPSAPTGPVSGPTIGTGQTRVALILPLSGPGQGAVAAASLRNAAEMAVAEASNPDITVLVKDDKGTPEGARDAASQALAEGAELIIGPLFAPSVQAVGQVARQAGRPVIAFSTDTAAATRGVYLLSFLPQAEVERVIDHAAAQGKQSFAALIPESAYGNVVEAAFRESAARRGVRVVAVERYAPGQGAAAVGRIAALVGGASPQADALFLPESGDALPAIGQALAEARFDPKRVKPLGTGVWNDPRAFKVAALQGGWFAAPDAAGYTAFAGRYRTRFSAEPTRIATLSYDAVSLAAALTRTQGSQRFSEPVLTNPSGFAGADGTFRFKPDGTNDRTLAVLEVRQGNAGPVSPAPKVLAAR